MPKTVQPPPTSKENSDPPHYASFIVRCWTNGDGQLRARLIEVNSGDSRPVANLEALPALVRRWVTQVFPPASPSEAEKPQNP